MQAAKYWGIDLIKLIVDQTKCLPGLMAYDQINLKKKKLRAKLREWINDSHHTSELASCSAYNWNTRKYLLQYRKYFHNIINLKLAIMSKNCTKMLSNMPHYQVFATIA